MTVLIGVLHSNPLPVPLTLTDYILKIQKSIYFSQDNDVYNERKRVLTGATDENDVVVIKELVKVWNQHNSKMQYIFRFYTSIDILSIPEWMHHTTSQDCCGWNQFGHP